jgi:uncharacterized lipoprotein YddW (UPF0748 family)
MYLSTSSLRYLTFLIAFGITVISGCTSQKIPEEEFRAVWLHQNHFDRNETNGKEQIINLFDEYAKIGINNLFCYYSLPEENNLDWDYLTFIVDEGNKRNIGIHPIFCPGHEVNQEKAMTEHPEWLIRKLNGDIYPAYNMAIPEVRQYWLSIISEALKYDIAGIHLDYIRYPVNQMFSYDSITCATFKKEYGFTPLEVAHDGGSIIWCEWIEWNQKQVSVLVSDVHKMIKESGKNILLGADVFPDPAESEIEIGQSWETWASEGIIDFVCPMLYTDSVSLFGKYIDKALIAAGSNCNVYPGIGIYTSHNKITSGILLDEIQTARDKNAGGVVFFSGNSLNTGLIDTLSKTVFKSLAIEK